MAPPTLPRLFLLPSICRPARAAAWPARRAHPDPRPRFPFPPPLIPSRDRSSPRAEVGGSPAWPVAAERRGARTAGRSSSGRTVWWTTWTSTSTACPSSMSPSGTPILLG